MEDIDAERSVLFINILHYNHMKRLYWYWGKWENKDWVSKALGGKEIRKAVHLDLYFYNIAGIRLAKIYEIQLEKFRRSNDKSPMVELKNQVGSNKMEKYYQASQFPS